MDATTFFSGGAGDTVSLYPGLLAAYATSVQLPAFAEAVEMTASTGVSQVLVLASQLHAPPSCWVTAGCPLVVMRTRMSPDESRWASHWLCVLARTWGVAVTVPAGPAELAAGVTELVAAAGRSVFDVPPHPASTTAVTASPAADHSEGDDREIEIREVTGG